MLTTLAVLALVLATVALLYARRQAREVARLKEMYWQLKYEHGELKATLAPPPGPPAPAQTSFVPLGAVKRNSP
jgi:hypothetical protein